MLKKKIVFVEREMTELFIEQNIHKYRLLIEHYLISVYLIEIK